MGHGRLAKRGVAAGEANGRTLTARRLVMQDLQDRAVVSKLFDTLAPRFEARPGGYTRLLRVGYRKGDSAEVAQVELVGSEYNPAEAKKMLLDVEPSTGEETQAVVGKLYATPAAVVELLGRPNGVGFEIGSAFQLFDVPRILAYSLAFVIVMLATVSFDGLRETQLIFTLPNADAGGRALAAMVGLGVVIRFDKW